MNESSFSTAYQLLVKDLLTIAEYINPSDANKTCHSHRLYELFLRACTEFENLCKSSYEKNIGPLPDRSNITHYKQLEENWKLEKQEVGILFWQNTNSCVEFWTPFENWSSNSPPLKWYKAYNNVKHNRDENFSEASLENVVLAVSGLFLALHAEFEEEIFTPYETNPSTKGSSNTVTGYKEIRINNSIFSIREKIF